VAINSVPLGIGFLAAYAMKELGDRISVRLFKFPDELSRAFTEDGPPDAIGFSNYCWNQDLSVGYARAVKRQFPETAVFFGGPNYPREEKKRQSFLFGLKDAVDFYIPGEGERATVHLLQRLIQKDFDCESLKNGEPIPHCSYIFQEKVVAGGLFPRIDISELPSPYLMGLLDIFIDAGLECLIQTARGCPFSCAYCVEGSPEYRRVSRRTSRQVKEEFEYVARKRPRMGNVFLADSNFGLFPGDVETARAVNEMRKKYGWPEFVHVATSKERKDRVLQVVRILEGRLRVANSIQSSDPVVLGNIHRGNVSAKDMLNLAVEATRQGGNTYSELILALPGDSTGKFYQSVRDVIDSGINLLRVYSLILLPGSELELEKKREEFGMRTRFRASPRCYGIYSLGEEEIPAIEIEEVCVTNRTMSFEDYVECRVFTLVIELFYNDGLNRPMFRLLNEHGIDNYRFLRSVLAHRHRMPSSIREIFRQFEEETRGELWESREALVGWAKTGRNLERFVNHEYGRNVVFAAKSVCYLRFMGDLLSYSYEIAKGLLETVDFGENARKEVYRLLDDMKLFATLRGDRVLDTSLKLDAEFHYDVRDLFEKEQDGPIAQGVFNPPRKLRFTHDPEQIKLIMFYKDAYGDTEAAHSRILSRLPLHRIYRRAV